MRLSEKIHLPDDGLCLKRDINGQQRSAAAHNKALNYPKDR
jgi:hypothetical protein